MTNAGIALHALIVDDSADDAALLVRELRKAGYAPACDRVESAGAMRTALAEKPWDIVFCDYVIPGFGGMEALRVARESGPDLPVILLSGKVGEETAVEAMRAGASDFVMKNKLGRLGAVVKRELADAAVRRAMRLAQIEWRAVFDSVQDAIFFHDAEYRVLRANLAYAALAGMPIQEIIGKPYWEIYPRCGGPLPGCHATMESGRPGEQEVKSPDGRTYGSRAYRIADRTGAYLHSIHMLQDVTERDRVKEAVETSERRLRSLIEHAPDLLVVVDANGTIKYASPSLTKMSDYLPDEVVGRSIMEFTHPDDVPAAGEALSAVVADPHSTVVAQLRFKGKNGVDFVLDSIAKNALADPAIGGIVLNARDITGRKRDEEALRASRDLLASIIEHAPVRVFWKGLDLRYLGCNSLFARDAGLSRPEDLIGKDDFQMTWHKQAELYRADDRCVIDSNTPKLGIEESQSTPDGRTIWLRTSKVPLQDAGGKAIGMLGVYEDITEIKRADEELRRLNWAMRALGQSNSALVHAATEQEMFHMCCESIAATDAYPLAWIGLLRDDGACSVEPVAAAGVATTYLDGIVVTASDTPEGGGPTGTAIRTGATQIVDDFTSERRFAPWLERARAHGLASSISLPIRPDRRVIGALMVYGRLPHAFGSAEIALFEELAGDIAYGIAARRMRDAYESGIVEQVRSAAKLRRSLEDSIQAIAATVEARDPYTAGHEKRVAELAAAIAREMALPESTVEGIHFGSLIHDLGKIQVPAEILSKPLRLTPLEYELIKVHAQAGYDILKAIEFPWPIAQMVLQHHERMDGSGYPNGLKGDAIIVEARVLAVADTVEAMASHRPYRPGLGVEAALGNIENNRGTLFDELVVDACLRLFREQGYSLPA